METLSDITEQQRIRIQQLVNRHYSSIEELRIERDQLNR